MDGFEKTQSLSLKNRKELIIDGIKNIVGFDSEYISLESDMGRINVEGKNLVIENLSKMNGEVTIQGDISGIFYLDMKNKQKGFFSKFSK